MCQPCLHLLCSLMSTASFFVRHFSASFSFIDVPPQQPDSNIQFTSMKNESVTQKIILYNNQEQTWFVKKAPSMNGVRTRRNEIEKSFDGGLCPVSPFAFQIDTSSLRWRLALLSGQAMRCVCIQRGYYRGQFGIYSLLWSGINSALCRPCIVCFSKTFATWRSAILDQFYLVYCYIVDGVLTKEMLLLIRVNYLIISSLSTHLIISILP